MKTISVLGPVLVGLGIGLQAQAPRGEQPLMPKSTAGVDLFRLYCSSCHGRDAKGRTDPSGVTTAPDLTRLSVSEGGTFPRQRVRSVITHGLPGETAHGTREMPVWGAIFRGLDPNDRLTEIRIANLVGYVESLQTVAGQTP
jgi:mono/diheme cytochrome c family protein